MRMTLLIHGASVTLALVAIGMAARRLSISQNRDQMLSAIKGALKNRSALWIGILFAAIYLAIFAVLGGKGGRIHVLFGRWIFNTTPAEVFIGIAMAILVMISMALFAHSIRMMGVIRSGKKCGAGVFGALLAALAAFCP